MIELELEPHTEALADPRAQDHQRLIRALGAPPLYHQWRTYQEKEAAIVINSYNTGTGKTKAALLRLLDLDKAYKEDGYRCNVLFIAPTNELLRQHEEDVQEFIKRNGLDYNVLRLDAATIKLLAQQHLGEKFIRQGDRLHQMLEDPDSVLLDSDGHHREGRHPYVLVINPDIFYYALYGLGNPHDQKVLFRDFVLNFKYIIVDEFHYYNAKQLANFLFFFTLSREWGYFQEGRTVCLLTATPSKEVLEYLNRLGLKIVQIEPGSEPAGLATTPALSPARLYLHSAEALENGLVSLATSSKAEVLEWLRQGEHGAFISSALWRINALYQEYGGKANRFIGRLTGAEQTSWRETNKLAALLMATPTVDIGYNFVRPGKQRQSIDFLFFDARSSDECIQRLGRAGRVLGKEICDRCSTVEAVVPEELVVELEKLPEKKLKRQELTTIINKVLPQKHGIYMYIHSGAIAEAFLPLYHWKKSLPSDQKAEAEQLYAVLCEVYKTSKGLSFKKLEWNTRRYLKLKSLLPDLLREAKSTSFAFGPASVIARTMDEEPDRALDMLDAIDEEQARKVESQLQKKGRAEEAERKRLAELEEYVVAAARFNFRETFQPPLALAYDPHGLLATSDYTIYSALHIAQNYVADWFALDHLQAREWQEKAGVSSQQPIKICCRVRALQKQRLSLYFTLSNLALTKKQWEARYCSVLTATSGFRLRSDAGAVPGELNSVFEKGYTTFYAVPAAGPEAMALNKLRRLTSLLLYPLRVDFGSEGEHEYMLIPGSAALLVSYERSIIAARHLVRRRSVRGSHIFDWMEEQ